MTAKTTTETDNGVQIDFIGGARLDGMRSAEKISEILDSVSNGKIVVLEEGLTPEEESRLVEVTMSRIEPDDFSGIEIESYPSSESSSGGLMNKLLGKDDEKESKMTFVGPANKIETLDKEEDLISTLVRQ